MYGSEIRFFATKKDFLDLFKSFDEIGKFKYTEHYSELNKSSLEVYKASDLINYMAKNNKLYPEFQVQHIFMITNLNYKLTFEEIELNNGTGYRKSLDQLFNPDSLRFFIGGEICSDILIASKINTTGESKESKRLFKLFKKAILKKSKYMSSFHVLKNAEVLLEQNWRLTSDMSHSRSIDLKKEI